MLLKIDFNKKVEINDNLLDVFDPVYAPGTDHELLRVLSNLLDNAIEAIPQERLGVVDVHLSVQDGNLEISLSDNGIGFPEELLPLAGKMSFTYNKQGGSGRGLFHAQRVLKHLDGELTVANLPKRGAEIRLMIPILH